MNERLTRENERLTRELLAEVAELIVAERRRQDSAWGPQAHSPPLWMTIMLEEFGETAAAYLEDRPDDLEHELVQTVAVGVAWLALIRQERRAREANERARARADVFEGQI